MAAGMVGPRLSFRFCNQILAVFATDDLRGADMATIAIEGGLQIIDITRMTAEGIPQSGYPDADIPACMVPPGSTPLPNGSAALVQTAIDPFDWNATRRRNAYADWQLDCQDPAIGLPITPPSFPGGSSGPVGDVRYSQAIPIELHPWSDRILNGVFVHPADMDRWPGPPGDQASCPDRNPGDVFDFAWTDADGSPRRRSGIPVPEHGQCNPAGTELMGDHMVDAAKVKPVHACRAPAEIRGREASKWHFFDTLCAEAQADLGAGGRDASVYFDASDYVGHPQPGGEPAPPACRYSSRCECEPEYTAGGNVALGWTIRKHRMIWKQAGNVVALDTDVAGWSQAREAVRRNGGSPAPTMDCVRQNYADCYKLVTLQCDSAEAANRWGQNQTRDYSVQQRRIFRDEDGNVLPPETFSGTATVTGTIVKKVYHPDSGGREELHLNSCSYSTGLGFEDGCNWGGMSEDGTCI